MAVITDNFNIAVWFLGVFLPQNAACLRQFNGNFWTVAAEWVHWEPYPSPWRTDVGRRRTAPTLRMKTTKGTRYWATDVRRPDGTRTTVNFGQVKDAQTAEVYAAFAQWLKLYQANPHKALSFKSPWEAVEHMTDDRAIVAMVDLVRSYERWASEEFGTLGKGSASPNFRRLQFANAIIVERYGAWPVASFGHDELRAVRQALMSYRYKHGGSEKGLTRKSINMTIQELRRMFSWAVARQIMQPAQERLLREVKMVGLGTAGVTEGEKRRPVTPAEFAAVTAAVNPTVADMMRVMWHVPIRPSEVCGMRPLDFVMDQETWLYVPGRDASPVGAHKTASRGKVRAIPITASVQAILLPRIHAAKAASDFLFSPKIATEELALKKWAARRTPLSSGNRPGTARVEHPMVKPGDRYQPTSFSNAIKRGCDRAGVERFTAYDLRRTVATRVEAILGRDAAQRLLGHTDPQTTNLYLLEPVKRAVEAAQQLEAASHAI